MDILKSALFAPYNSIALISGTILLYSVINAGPLDSFLKTIVVLVASSLIVISTLGAFLARRLRYTMKLYHITISYKLDGSAIGAWQEIARKLQTAVPQLPWTFDTVVGTIRVQGELVMSWRRQAAGKWTLDVCGYYIEDRPYKGAKLALAWGITGRSNAPITDKQLAGSISLPVEFHQYGLGLDLKLDAMVAFHNGTIGDSFVVSFNTVPIATVQATASS